MRELAHPKWLRDAFARSRIAGERRLGPLMRMARKPRVAGLHGEPRRICSKRARKLCLLFGRADDVVAENVMFRPLLGSSHRRLGGVGSSTVRYSNPAWR
jgi:hypothetical protein